MGVKSFVTLAALVLGLTGAAAAGRVWLTRTPAAAPSGGVWRVSEPASLQDALDRAQPGDTIVLDAGRVYEGPFVLRAHPAGDAWITIRGAREDALAPALSRLGRRVTPAEAPQLPKLVAASGNVIAVEKRAHHYRLVGLEIAPAANTFLTTLVDLGTPSSDPADLPHDFDLERLYVHGDPDRGSRRGVALNAAAVQVADSYFADFKEAGNDSQAICGWSGPGPYAITNNYLEAAGENLMFGGGDPPIANLVPSDIEIRGNVLSKPIAWRVPPAGTPAWTVKNLLELKNARRVVIDGNVLEQVWTAAQVGFAVLFTPRNQDGAAPWSTVEDVTFQNNVVRHASGGIDLLGRDNIHQSQPLSRVRIANNLFEDVTSAWGSGRLFEIVDGTSDVSIDHNTAVNVQTALFAGETVPHTAFRFTNNIVVSTLFGIIGTGTASGTPTLDRYFPGAVVQGNAMLGDPRAVYPNGNLAPASVDDLGFANPAKDDYSLRASSPLHHRATDGTDVGVDMSALVSGDRARPRTAVDAPPSGVARFGFWLAVWLIGYVYVGYPVIVWIAARTAPRPVRRAAWCPDITIVVVAYNEAARIRRRVEDLDRAVYGGRRTIVVVSDGSTDATVAEAMAASPRVRVIALPERRGKPAALNAVLPTLATEIVVLADARQRFAPDAIQALVADLADPEVGAVSGQLVLGGAASSGAAQGAGLYWRYETCLRRWESAANSSVGVTGAITALRRSLFEALPVDTLVDDLLIPLRVMRRGYRVVFEPLAHAYDGLPASARDEFARKVRTLAGNIQLFAHERWLWRPSQNRLWVQTMSHKFLRLVLPLLFSIALLTNTVLVQDGGFYAWTFAAQVGFYATAAAAWRVPVLRRRIPGFVVPYTICLLSCATLIAFVRFATGGQTVTWHRSAVHGPA